VERLTGQTNAADVNVELQIVIGLDALLDANNQTPDAGFMPHPSAGLWLVAIRIAAASTAT
jgi:hypothetical protein